MSMFTSSVKKYITWNGSEVKVQNWETKDDPTEPVSFTAQLFLGPDMLEYTGIGDNEEEALSDLLVQLKEAADGLQVKEIEKTWKEESPNDEKGRAEAVESGKVMQQAAKEWLDSRNIPINAIPPPVQPKPGDEVLVARTSGNEWDDGVITHVTEDYVHGEVLGQPNLSRFSYSLVSYRKNWKFK